MKHALFFFFSFCYSFCIAQNLVRNPSFEEYSTCPTWVNSQTMENCSSYRMSPDYFNACSTIPYSGVSVPYALPGAFQYPSSGNAYVGIYTYLPYGQGNDEREIVGCELLQPLQIGKRYFVSLKANLATISIYGTNNCVCVATDHLGVLFTTVPYSTANSLTPNNFAHIYSPSIITDTLRWTTIFDSFIADSAYNYMAFGNFFDTTQTNRQYLLNCLNPSDCYYSSYYFIDDICVSTDSLFAANYSWITGIKQYHVSEFNLYPNPSQNGIFYCNKTFYKEPVKVLDISGRIVKQLAINGNEIDLSSLSNGIYILSFEQYFSIQKISITK